MNYETMNYEKFVASLVFAFNLPCDWLGKQIDQFPSTKIQKYNVQIFTNFSTQVGLRRRTRDLWNWRRIYKQIISLSMAHRAL